SLTIARPCLSHSRRTRLPGLDGRAAAAAASLSTRPVQERLDGKHRGEQDAHGQKLNKASSRHIARAYHRMAPTARRGTWRRLCPVRALGWTDGVVSLGLLSDTRVRASNTALRRLAAGLHASLVWTPTDLVVTLLERRMADPSKPPESADAWDATQWY